MNRVGNPTVLLLTPSTQYGSWGWFEDVIATAPTNWEWQVVSYGRPFGLHLNRNGVYFSGPLSGDYTKFGRFLNGHSNLAFLNVLWYIPLLFPLLKVRCLEDPVVLVGNGIIASALCLVFAAGRPVVFAHHVYSGWVTGIQKWLFASVVHRCATVIANSEGGAADIRLIAPADGSHIRVIPIWSSSEFFEYELELPSSPVPRVVYVGRCDDDKCGQAFRVCVPLARAGAIEFLVVGLGPLVRELNSAPNVVAFGYVSDRSELAGILRSADWVWAPADTTYLSRPAWEALACGAKVIVSDHPPAQEKVKRGVRISRDILPADCGQVVSGDDDLEAIGLLTGPDSDDRVLDHRVKRRAYSREQALMNGPQQVVDIIDSVWKFGSRR